MEFTRMSFDLVTAYPTYIWLMRIMLAGLANVSFYFDNIFVYSSDWPTHISTLKFVLDRLQPNDLPVWSRVHQHTTTFNPK